MRDNDTPTWNAIELSSPVAFAVRLEMGELKLVAFRSSPLVRNEGLQNGLSSQGEGKWCAPLQGEAACNFRTGW